MIKFPVIPLILQKKSMKLIYGWYGFLKKCNNTSNYKSTKLIYGWYCWLKKQIYVFQLQNQAMEISGCNIDSLVFFFFSIFLYYFLIDFNWPQYVTSMSKVCECVILFSFHNRCYYFCCCLFFRLFTFSVTFIDLFHNIRSFSRISIVFCLGR